VQVITPPAPVRHCGEFPTGHWKAVSPEQYCSVYGGLQVHELQHQVPPVEQWLKQVIVPTVFAGFQLSSAWSDVVPKNEIAKNKIE